MVYRNCPFRRIYKDKKNIMVAMYLVYLCIFLIWVDMVRYSVRSRELVNHNFSALLEDFTVFKKNTTQKPNSTIGLSKYAAKVFMKSNYLHASNNDFTLVILVESGYETRRDTARRTWINALENQV